VIGKQKNCNNNNNYFYYNSFKNNFQYEQTFWLYSFFMNDRFGAKEVSTRPFWVRQNVIGTCDLKRCHYLTETYLNNAVLGTNTNVRTALWADHFG